MLFHSLTGYGYKGYHKGGGHLWWGVSLSDFITLAPLWVPTFMLDHGMDQIRVRKGFIPDETIPDSWPPGDAWVQGEADAVAASGMAAYEGATWSRCSAHGVDGWTPWAPFAFDWLAKDNPRGARRMEEANLCAFWDKHGIGAAGAGFPQRPCPGVFPFSQGAQISVTRAQVLARPKGFWAGLTRVLRVCHRT